LEPFAVVDCVQLMRESIKQRAATSIHNPSRGIVFQTEDSAMSLFKTLVPAVVIACSSFAVSADDVHAVVTPLMTKALPEFPGKEAHMITVDYPPGSVDPVHRHDAHAFVYVLEGTIVMQVKGGKEVTLKPGQSFYEGPDDVHVVGRNASSTEPAKFLVVFIKKAGAPILTVE
jgi:quercetin dioxygenase-like cupin family protein